MGGGWGGFGGGGAGMEGGGVGGMAGGHLHFQPGLGFFPSLFGLQFVSETRPFIEMDSGPNDGSGEGID